MTGQPFAEARMTAKDGITLYARDYPPQFASDRLPVVCIHGLTRNTRDFESLAPWLASLGRRVIAVDVRGRGRSGYDPDPMRYHPGTYAGDIAGQLRALGVRRAIFLGTSMGGIITMLLAARLPRLVAGAILNDVGPEIAPAGVARIAAYVTAKVAVAGWPDAIAHVERVHAAGFPALDTPTKEMLARRLFREDEAGRPVLDHDPDIAVPLARGRLAAPRWLGWALFRWLARRPVLLIRGERSDILDPVIAAKMQRAARRLTYVQVPGVGHAPFLDEPEARAAIAAWLETAP